MERIFIANPNGTLAGVGCLLRSRKALLLLSLPLTRKMVKWFFLGMSLPFFFFIICGAPFCLLWRKRMKAGSRLTSWT